MKLGIFTALFGDWPLEKVARYVSGLAGQLSMGPHDSSTDAWAPPRSSRCPWSTASSARTSGTSGTSSLRQTRRCTRRGSSCSPSAGQQARVRLQLRPRHAKDGELQEDEVRRSGVIPTGGWMRPDRGFRFRVPGWGQVDWRRVMTAPCLGGLRLRDLLRARGSRDVPRGRRREGDRVPAAARDQEATHARLVVVRRTA
jgi:hypothetical protein